MATQIPEGGRRFQQPTTLDYILLEENLDFNSLVVDSDRLISIPSDHVMIYVEVNINKNEYVGPIPVMESNDGFHWDRRAMRNEERMHEFADSLTENLMDQNPNDDIQLEYDRLHKIIQHTAKSFFLKENAGRRGVRLPRRYYELRSTLRKARKQLRENQRLMKPVYDVHAWIWRVRVKLKEVLSRLKVAELENLSYKLNNRRNGGIRFLYDYVKKRKNGPNKVMLLRDKEGNAILEEEAIQKSLFNQIEKIFQDNNWPFSNNRYVIPDFGFNQEAVDLMDAEITEQEVRKALTGLRGGKSAGPTDIPPELLKNVPVEVIDCIVDWANNILERGELPVQNETSNMIFLFKKGDPTKLDNYRTLATGCNLCKIFLKIVANRLQSAAEASGILGNIQMGFRPNMGCADNLFIMDTIMSKMKSGKNKKYVMALLDISKAYDRVSRPLLWEKLESYGMPRRMIEVIQAAYLNAGSCISFQNVRTDRKEIHMGLKQGCVMSPILFSLYLADLGAILERSGFGIEVGTAKIPGLFFADDIIIWEEEKKFQEMLYLLADYASHWKLQFSASKSFVMPVHRPANPDNKWCVGFDPTHGQPDFMSEVEEVKYLGINIRRKHNIFSPHLEALKKKIMAATFFIRRMMENVVNPLQIVKNLWEIYVQSAVLYGINAMGFPRHYVEDLEKMERSFLKSILGLPQSSKNEVPYILTCIKPMSLVLFRNRIKFRISILNRFQNSWMKECLLEQEEWGNEERFLEGEFIRRVKISNRTSSFMIREIANVAQEEVDFLREVLVVRRQQYAQVTLDALWKRRVELLRENHVSLRYVGEIEDPVDTVYNKLVHRWWMKCKAGVRFLKFRKKYKNGELTEECLRCGNPTEDLEHFLLECSDIDTRVLVEMVPKVLAWNVVNILRWMLSAERTRIQRENIDLYVRRLMKERDGIIDGFLRE